MRRLIAAILCFLPSLGLVANPSGGTVVSGTATITTVDSSLLEVRPATGSSGTTVIIEWDSFDISSTQKTAFIRSTEFNVLNRVTGTSASTINGILTAENGNVWLVNQNGMAFGSNATVMCNTLLFSTLAVSNSQFTSYLAGSNITISGTTNKTITNNGVISTTGGDLILVGYKVVNDNSGSNNGQLLASAGAVRVGAGTSVLIKPSGTERIFIESSETTATGTGIDQDGYIAAESTFLKADGGAYALAINQEGTITSSACATADGKVYLIATGSSGVIENSGSIGMSCSTGQGSDVRLVANRVALTDTGSINTSGSSSGGNVQIGGTITQAGSTTTTITATQVYTAPNTTITASATGTGSSGDGGTVSLAGTTSVLAEGDITARGGALSGDGGTVTMTSAGYVGSEGTVTLSPQSSATTDGFGTLTITTTTAQVAGASNSGTNFQPPNWTTSSATSMITKDSLQNSLAGSNVSIVTTGTSGSGVGDITVVDNFTWASGTRFLANAGSNVNMNFLATQTGTPRNATDVVIDLTGNRVLIGTSAQTHTVPVGFTTSAGVVNVTATTQLGLWGGMAANASAILNTSSGAMNINVGSSTVAGDIDVIAGSSTGTSATISNAVGVMDINLGGDLTITGGSTTGSAALITNTGTTINIDGTSSFQGDITITAGNCSMAGITSVGGTINIGTSVKPVNITMTAGACASANYAMIGNSTTGGVTLNVNASGAILATGGTGGASNIAGFLDFGGSSSATITGASLTLNAGNSSVSGGVSNNAVVDITGPVTITMTDDITLQGSTSGNINSQAYITGTTVTFTANDDVTITGGATTFSSAYITGTSGVTGTIGDDITVRGGTANGANAYITVTSGNLSLNAANSNPGNLLVAAGNSGSDNANASIRIDGNGDMFLGSGQAFNNITLTGGGAGIDTSALVRIAGTGDLFIVANDITATGGSGANSPARFQVAYTSGTGDIDILSNDFTLQGGSGATSDAVLTAGNTGGDITISSQGSVSVKGGSGQDAFAEIKTTNGLINITAVQDILHQGGSGQDAFGRIYSVLGDKISLLASRDVRWTAGSGSGAYARTHNGEGLVHVLAERYISMQGNVGGASATILADGVRGEINTQANDSHFQTGNAHIHTPAGNGYINVKAANSIVIQQSSTIRNDVSGGYISIGTNICSCSTLGDNCNGGTFLDSSSSFLTVSGDVRLFTTFYPNSTVVPTTDQCFCVVFTNCSASSSATGLGDLWMRYNFLFELFYRLRRWNYLDWYLLGLTDFWSSGKNTTAP
ncbi:MAG: hypothetical protein S4CHLAM102_08250 [Chlamydiia bacterium]|nr:hypothetical protein [Chlamydiia bacterium]